MARPSASLIALTLTLGCVEGGSLAISAGAPALAAVQGRITDCGLPVGGATVVVTIEQDEPEQARPVHAQVGPLTTRGDGFYVAEIGPAFAIPGEARVDLGVTAAGVTLDITGGRVHFSLGSPPRDTLRLDADLGAARGFCLP